MVFYSRSLLGRRIFLGPRDVVCHDADLLTSSQVAVIYCMHDRYNTALEPTPVTPFCFRFGFGGGSHRRHGLALERLVKVST